MQQYELVPVAVMWNDREANWCNGSTVPQRPIQQVCEHITTHYRGSQHRVNDMLSLSQAASMPLNFCNVHAIDDGTVVASGRGSGFPWWLVLYDFQDLAGIVRVGSIFITAMNSQEPAEVWIGTAAVRGWSELYIVHCNLCVPESHHLQFDWVLAYGGGM
jgi:hypothetical protein